MRRLLAIVATLVLFACHAPASNMSGGSDDHKPWNGIRADETISLSGTEPFWNGEVAGRQFRYTTPEKPEGETVAVDRFAGRGGVSFSGTLDGAAVTLAVSPGQCSDGMSERSYPFTAILRIGDGIRQGCAWTKKSPFSGGQP